MPGCLSARVAMVSSGFMEQIVVSEDRMADRTRTVSPMSGSLSLTVLASSPTCFSLIRRRGGGERRGRGGRRVVFGHFPFLLVFGGHNLLPLISVPLGHP
jgi:hypothetical protein